MQDVLSQGEIDSLLAALTSGELSLEEAQKTAAPLIKPYDFRRPNKFSKEHLRTLEIMHQHFARLLSSFLSGYLRAAINVEMASVGQMIYEEFIRSIPSPTALAVFGLKPLEGPALLEINTQVIFPMLDLLFGGPGTSSDQIRELTDIEVTVARRLVERILEHLAQAWHDFYTVEPRVENIESNPRMQQLYSPNEVVALITFSVSINDEERGFVNLCLPYLLMEPVISRLSVRQQFSRQAGGPRPEDLERLSHWLGFSRVELQVILGEAEITVHELLQLQEGDVLVLNRHLNEDLDLYVEGERKFGVQAGRVGQNLAVQVVSLSGEDMNGE
ncbi:MAG: flagellar motor switch protein FliM [Thermoanaerobacter sp.]|jgi:flagellar motor switch protein FliM|uniref:flagellar motor switch protein FliM n=1 Tax=Desulfofundulus thermocisternus TaxID=42471 RepID=UPI000485CA24|nr:flagellar motor switch protein FliM [Desulfofundulus thermocisternus]MDK2887535.1 flagellar motor switch protein FliM [Thermoanaerobacter sp.]